MAFVWPSAALLWRNARKMSLSENYAGFSGEENRGGAKLRFERGQETSMDRVERRLNCSFWMLPHVHTDFLRAWKLARPACACVRQRGVHPSASITPDIKGDRWCLCGQVTNRPACTLPTHTHNPDSLHVPVETPGYPTCFLPLCHFLKSRVKADRGTDWRRVFYNFSTR